MKPPKVVSGSLELILKSTRHLSCNGRLISSGQKYVAGKYLEKVGSKKQCQTYKLMQKNVYFFKNNIIYPFVNFQARKEVYSISDSEYSEVIQYAEHIHIL